MAVRSLLLEPIVPQARAERASAAAIPPPPLCARRLPLTPRTAKSPASGAMRSSIDAAVVQSCPSLTRIDVSCNDLRELPPELGLLKLAKLTIHGNPLRTLPSSLLNGATPKLLEHLRGKIVTGREGSGWEADGATLAAPDLATAVQRSGNELSLKGQSLRELPDGICSRDNLEKLDLSSNAMTNLTDEIGDLASLRKLTLDQNSLSQLPAVLFMLPHLTELSVEHNRLERLPAVLWSAPRLARVSLRANRLTAASLNMPPEASAPIQALDLGENRLGSVPPLASLTNLNELHMQGNGIASLPVEALPLRSLTTLDIRDNDLTNLPPQLSLASALQALSLSGNPLRSVPISVQQKGAGAVLALLARRMPEQ
uniref:Uncharacterized protein n=1 Tax=Haptolina ericina TaxID=156174 RepID=A0A7S3EQ32_9EUKA